MSFIDETSESYFNGSVICLYLCVPISAFPIDDGFDYAGLLFIEASFC